MKKYSDYEYASISMSTDKLFLTALDTLFATNKINAIVESGTYVGLGSTTMLAKAILKSGKPLPNFITIEVDELSYRKALKNLAKYSFITPTWGLSVSVADAKEFIKNDDAILNHEKYPDIFIDTIDNPASFYLNEVNGQLSRINQISFFQKIKNWRSPSNKTAFEENILQRVVPAIKNANPLFLLDSAGGLGYLEFQTVKKLIGENTHFLILDDIHHLKHFRSFRDVSEDSNYKIIAKNIENGWLIAKYEKQ
jgi:hypothetical protein